MSVNLYTPDSNVIVHETKVDFRRRVVQRQINLVQYDKSMPVIAVQLCSNGNEYVLPENASAYIRFGKRDHTYVYNECLGCDQTRTIVYFAITDQMTVFYGEHTPIVELRIGDTVAGSGSIPIWIDRNPIQNGDTESKSDLSVFEKAIEAAQKINVKLPTDLKATATNLSLLAGDTKIGSGINLSGFEYDEETKTLKAKGGGASVSPTLNLLTEDLSAVRSSITEEEKVNLEKGLYNSVLFVDFSLGDGAMTGTLFPQHLVGLDGDFMFSSYKAKPGTSEADDWSFLGASIYGLSIGAKTSDGNYPITIKKLSDVNFGGGGGSSLPEITTTDVGKFLTVTSEQKIAWVSVPQGSPIEIVLDETKPYFNVGEYNGKIGVFVLSRPNNTILYEAKFDDSSATFTKILLYGSMKADTQNVDYLNVSGSLYGLNSNSILTYIGSGSWQLKSEDNYKFLPYPYSQEASLCCAGGISGAIPAFTLYGSAIGKTSPDYIGLLPQVCKYCALRYDFKKTSSTTDVEKVTSAFFGSVSADNVLEPTKITLIGIFDNGVGKAVLEKNASGVFESKTPIEYVEDVNAITYSKARYEHTITIKNSEGKILWTQTMRNSKDTVVNSYTNLKTLFGEATYGGFGEYCQLDLHGGTEATDKLIKADGTEATLASLGAIVYTDVCFLPK